jgi:serine/threonine-protein kinase
MKRYIKVGGLVGIFVLVTALAAYLTLRWIVTGEDVVVPDLVGKDVVYTLELLTDLGLNTKVSGHEYSAEIPKNHVTFQQPEPGSEIKKDRDVRIVVSKGPQTVTVPNLIGLDIHAANVILEENGLTRGVTSETYDESAEAGQIMGQVPGPGTLVERGMPIDFLTALGDRPVNLVMPRLKGRSMRDAVLLLERSQLSLGQIEYVADADLPEEIILKHDPHAGFPVPAGSLVHLTVNRKKHETMADDHTFHLFSYAVSPGFLKKHVRFRINAFGLVYDLLDVLAKPGQRLEVLLPGGKDTRFFLYEDDDLLLAHSFGSRAALPTSLPGLEAGFTVREEILSEDNT